MIELLRQRRSIRQFTDQKIEQEKIDILKEAVLRSPSSRNFEPWEFVFVSDEAILAELSEAKEHGSKFLKDVQLAIVICGDQTVSDVWVEDCSIASIIAQLTAQSLGLGSCWVQIHKRMHDDHMTSNHYVKEVLNLPDGVSVESIIGIGYPAETPSPRKATELNNEKIHDDKWVKN